MALWLASAAHAADPLPAATTRTTSASDLARRPDQRRNEDPLTFMLGGRPLELTGEYELTLQRRRNLDLDKTEPDRRNRIGHELTLEALLRWSPGITVFGAINGIDERDTFREGGTARRERAVSRDQMWMYLESPLGAPFALQAGRIALEEPRTWWWDDELDALRLSFGGSAWRVETGLARELFKVSNKDEGIAPDQRGVWRFFGRATHEWQPRHQVEAFALVARDRSATEAVGTVVAPAAEDESDARLTWLGLRLIGDERLANAHRLRYWLDLAQVRGRESKVSYDEVAAGSQVSGVANQRVTGSAYDAGLTWMLDAPLRPSLSLATARGSGDGTARSFRQTGLQENKTRYGGVTRFQRYGEVLRPALANLRVETAVIGLRPSDDSSIDLAWHRVRQTVASTRFDSDRLDATPAGRDTALGSELDLVFGWRLTRSFETALRLGEFRAGPAFGTAEGERARLLELSATLDF